MRKHGILAGLIAAVLGTAATDGRADQETQSESVPAKLNEIVVTAQKREERLQDVPVSISVLSGDDLDRSNADGMTEMLKRVPGVATLVAFQSGGSQVSVRGVTASNTIFNGSSPVAYYLDSAPFGLVKSAIAPDTNVYDLERVEVLRGPQGTLYGASALNGVVRVLTKDADLNAFELKGRASGSSTEDGAENYRADLALNVPIVEGKLAARAVVGYEDLDGWIDREDFDDSNDTKQRNLRLKINAQPTDQLSIGLSSWSSRSDYGGPPVGDAQLRTRALLDESINIDYDVSSLEVGFDFSNFSLSSVTSYLDYSNRGVIDLRPFFLFAGIGDFSAPFTTDLRSEVLTQEFLLSSRSGQDWRWSVGAMYRDAEDRLIQPEITVDFTDISESYAVFGELTRIFRDGEVELTAGWRHFEDRVVNRENISFSGAPDLYRQSDKFDAGTPRLVLTWHASDRTMAYASYSEGFRSGFPQNSNVSLFPAVDADKLKNYEIGTKGSLLGGRIGYEAAVLYLKWLDVQQTLLVPLPGNPAVLLTTPVNGESASGVGFDFALTAQPIDGLELGLGFSWNDLTLDRAVISSGATVFEAGDRLNLSPEYTIGASADYVFPLGGRGLRGRFSLSGNFTSELTFRELAATDPPTIVLSVGEDMFIARTSFAIESADRWSAELFVENLNNEQDTPLPIPPGNPSDWDLRIRPRTVGVQLGLRF